MKIGVYGDSFAAKWAFSKIENHWWHKLAEMLSAEVECFGKSGTSTFFSYKHFLENHHKFDINIFFVTNSYRYTKHVELSTGIKEYFATYDQVDVIVDRYKKSLNSSDLLMLDNIRGWFLASDDEYNETCQDLILQDILSKNKNVIIYPSFPDSIREKTTSELKLDLRSNALDWTYKVHEWFNIDGLNGYDERLDVIACHFTPEINLAFAQSMYNYIVRNDPLAIPNTPIKHEHELTYYFRRT